MNLSKIRVLLFVVVVILLQGSTTSNNGIKIIYIGNCGFLYEHLDKKVVIDPFGSDYGDYFHLPSKETKMKIIKGELPFQNIDILLITHIHGDHFNSHLTEKFLLENPNTIIICPPQVKKQMIDSCQNFKDIESQFVSPEIKIGEFFDTKVNDIYIKGIRMQHGTMRSLEGINYSEYTEYEKTENFGYVIKLGKKSIFHQGDACLKINKSALETINHDIDVAHLSYFDWDTTSYNILKNKLHAKNIIFMHGTIPANEFEKDDLKSIMPQLIYFKQELDSITLN